MRDTPKPPTQPVIAEAVTVPTSSMQAAADTPRNPFRNPKAKPHWAELSRLAGDRAAILFQELRRDIAKIEGLEEDLHYHGPAWGWAPRYRLGGRALFSAHILPGRLEASIELDDALREVSLKSLKVAASLKEAVRAMNSAGVFTALRLPLPNLTAVRAFARLVVIKSKRLISAA